MITDSCIRNAEDERGGAVGVNLLQFFSAVLEFLVVVREGYLVGVRCVVVVSFGACFLLAGCRRS